MALPRPTTRRLAPVSRRLGQDRDVRIPIRAPARLPGLVCGAPPAVTVAFPGFLRADREPRRRGSDLGAQLPRPSPAFCVPAPEPRYSIHGRSGSPISASFADLASHTRGFPRSSAWVDGEAADSKPRHDAQPVKGGQGQQRRHQDVPRFYQATHGLAKVFRPGGGGIKIRWTANGLRSFITLQSAVRHATRVDCHA